MDFTIEYFSAGKGSSPNPPAYTCTKGMRPWGRFVYVMNGTIIFNEGSRNCVRGSKGTILYIPDDSPYHSKWLVNETAEFRCINFVLKNQGKPITFSNDICILEYDKANSYKLIFSEIVKKWLIGSLGYKIKCMSMFLDLLHTLALENIRSHITQQCSSISKGILYLENNYISDVTVEELSGMCNVSPSTFRRLFHNYVNISPIQYRNKLRMKKAAELLRSGDFTVTEASNAVNCPDVYYFNKLFNHIYGINPKEAKPKNK